MFLWVRSVQSGGGHSSWHLLNSKRKAQRTWRAPTPTDPYARASGEREFAVTMCGYDFDDFDVRPATRPVRGGTIPVFPSNGSFCQGCSNLARLLVTTPESY